MGVDVGTRERVWVLGVRAGVPISHPLAQPPCPLRSRAWLERGCPCQRAQPRRATFHQLPAAAAEPWSPRLTPGPPAPLQPQAQLTSHQLPPWPGRHWLPPTRRQHPRLSALPCTLGSLSRSPPRGRLTPPGGPLTRYGPTAEGQSFPCAPKLSPPRHRDVTTGQSHPVRPQHVQMSQLPGARHLIPQPTRRQGHLRPTRPPSSHRWAGQGGCEPWGDAPSPPRNEEQSGSSAIDDNQRFWPGLLNAGSWGCSGSRLCSPGVPAGPIKAAPRARTLLPGQCEGRWAWLEGSVAAIFSVGFAHTPTLDSRWAGGLLGWEGAPGSQAPACRGGLCVPLAPGACAGVTLGFASSLCPLLPSSER